MRKLPLYARIFLGMVIGLLMGVLALVVSWETFVIDWVKPFGTIFMNLLQVIAIPLILASLISGVSSLRSISRLTRIGGRTLIWFLITTVLAAGIGLAAVNLINPGAHLSKTNQEQLAARYGSDAGLRVKDAGAVTESGPLQVLVDMVPNNIIGAASSNRTMMQVIFFALLFGIALTVTPQDRAQPVRNFFDGLHTVILKMVELIMRVAPFGVMALIAGLVVEIQSWQLFQALGIYALTVLLCFTLMVFMVYPVVIQAFTPLRYASFIRKIIQVQLMALSTSSSAATLPVTMECAQRQLRLKDEISSFVLPLGTTINMDGTAIHQAVTAVFIAQVFGHDLTLADQIIVLFTATLTSIGAAGVPSGGLSLLVVVLGAIGVSPEGLALIIAIDRPLDMCRTVVNVTGDLTVATLVASAEGGFNSKNEIPVN